MSDFKSLREKLKMKSPPSLVKQRKGARGKMLDYMEWYTYTDILDAKCEYAWTTEILSVTAADDVVSVAVRLNVDGISVDNIGSEKATHSDPAASAFAQAFKRCCALLGLGRDLYRDPADLTWDQYEAVSELMNNGGIEDEYSDTIKQLIEDGELTGAKAVGILDYYDNNDGKDSREEEQ